MSLYSCVCGKHRSGILCGFEHYGRSTRNGHYVQTWMEFHYDINAARTFLKMEFNLLNPSPRNVVSRARGSVRKQEREVAKSIVAFAP